MKDEKACNLWILHGSANNSLAMKHHWLEDINPYIYYMLLYGCTAHTWLWSITWRLYMLTPITVYCLAADVWLTYEWPDICYICKHLSHITTWQLMCDWYMNLLKSVYANTYHSSLSGSWCVIDVWMGWRLYIQTPMT